MLDSPFCFFTSILFHIFSLVYQVTKFLRGLNFTLYMLRFVSSCLKTDSWLEAWEGDCGVHLCCCGFYRHWCTCWYACSWGEVAFCSSGPFMAFAWMVSEFDAFSLSLSLEIEPGPKLTMLNMALWRDLSPQNCGL